MNGDARKEGRDRNRFIFNRGIEGCFVLRVFLTSEKTKININYFEKLFKFLRERPLRKDFEFR